jgi:membrane protein implicated in regulation of membrane protease activity
LNPNFNPSFLPWIWLVIAGISILIEVGVPSFGFIFAGLGALVAAVISSTSPRLEWQFTGFIVTLVFSLWVLRPRILGKLHSRQKVLGRTERLIGKIGIVTEVIDPASGAGRIQVEGQDWAASSAQVLVEGCSVQVVESDGIVLKVKRCLAEKAPA